MTFRTDLEPIHPIGQCFESVGLEIIGLATSGLAPRAIHAIVRATAPGQEGDIIAHAWIECADGFAYDTTWGTKMPARQYRKDLRVSYCKEYDFKTFILRWKRKGHPGPWDEKIIAVTKEGKCNK